MILVNKNTTQSPISSGRTGTQSIKFIPAPRVYICAADLSSSPVPYFGPSYGVTPPGMTDLGIVSGNAVVTLSRSTGDVFAGVDKFCVGTYALSKSGRIEFSLSQLDDYVVENILGIAPTNYSTNIYANYLVGAQPLKQCALLLVAQNKLDGKEWQFYNPAALLAFSYDGSGDALALKVSGILPGFAMNSAIANTLLSLTVIKPGQTVNRGYGYTPFGLNYGDPA